MRGLACLVALGALATLAATPATAAEAAPSGHAARNCGILAAGANDFRVRARNVSCRFARRWARRYLRGRNRPRGYSCYALDAGVPVYCQRASRAYWAKRL